MMAKNLHENSHQFPFDGHQWSKFTTWKYVWSFGHRRYRFLFCFQL